MEDSFDWTLVPIFATALIVFSRESNDQSSLKSLVPLGALVARALDAPFGAVAVCIGTAIVVMDEERADIPIRTKIFVAVGAVSLLIMEVLQLDGRAALAMASLGAVFAAKLESGLAPPATRLAAGLVLVGVAALDRDMDRAHSILHVLATFVTAMEP